MSQHNVSGLTATLAALLLVAASGAASANVEVRFFESAPKDSFSFTNVGTCQLNKLTVELDLSDSAGKLIFDTTDAGAGVEVFQPFEVREGSISEYTPSGSGVTDGDDELAVIIADLAPGQKATFTIDVDDTLTNSELGNIRVSKSEIAGGKVTVIHSTTEQITGTFDTSGKILLPLDAC